MSFIASLAAAGSAIAATAGTVGAGLAAGAGAIGSGLAAGAGALGSGLATAGGALASGAGAVGSGIGSLGATIGEGLGLGAAEGAGALGATEGAIGSTAGTLGSTVGGTTGTLGASGSSALGGMLTPASMGISTPVATSAAPVAGSGLASGGFGAGTFTPASMGMTSIGSTGASAAPIAAAGTNAAASPGLLGSIGDFAAAHPVWTGAGVGALGGAVTNPNDPMKGAISGGAAGALGGWGASALGGAGGAIGEFATAHPYITSGGISMLANPLINSVTPDFASTLEDDRTKATEKDRQEFLRYLRGYTPTLAPGYAAGGITDLDGYMSQAQNIPNPMEVADPSSGYGSNSVQQMADGGIARFGIGGNIGNWLAKNSLPGMIFDWKSASDIPLIGGMFNDPNIANLTPEEKKKLMDMAAAQGKPVQQMAHGGIADLGAYAAGGRPNLLHGPGDGVSDDIPASIAGRQPARLASGEYVIPSRIVSELGNGSTDAGAKRLDMMVQKVNAGRAQTLGGKRYAKDTRAYKHLPV